jgi:hypothetical protein
VAVLGCLFLVAQVHFLIDSSGDVCQQTGPVHFDAGPPSLYESNGLDFMPQRLVEAK